MPETAGNTNTANEWRVGIVFANSTIGSRGRCHRKSGGDHRSKRCLLFSQQKAPFRNAEWGLNYIARKSRLFRNSHKFNMNLKLDIISDAEACESI